MRDGQCPKCGSGGVHLVDAAHLAIPVGRLHVAPLEYLVCARCGYVELYVKDKGLLPKIAEKYVSIAELKEIND